MPEKEAAVRRMPGWIPRHDRKDVSLGGVAVLADGRRIPVEITNLSEDGCALRSDETIGIGESVHLNVPPIGDLVGKIRWSLFGRAGIRFVSNSE